MSFSRRLALLLLVLALPLGCSKGIFLLPVNLAKASETEWAIERPNFRLVVPRLGGSVAVTIACYLLNLENRTESRIDLEEAVLETKGQAFDVTFYGQGDERWRSSAPGSTGPIQFCHRFTQPLEEVFGDTASLRMVFRVGAESEVVQIDFERK